jgi:hypothetical protein
MDKYRKEECVKSIIINFPIRNCSGNVLSCIVAPYLIKMSMQIEIVFSYNQFHHIILVMDEKI